MLKALRCLMSISYNGNYPRASDGETTTIVGNNLVAQALPYCGGGILPDPQST